MNLRQLILSQPKRLASGAAAALLVGLGLGWLARAPIDRAMAHTPAQAPLPAATGVTVVDTPVPARAASAPITADLYPTGLGRGPRLRAAGQDFVSGDQPWAADDETQPRGDSAQDLDRDRPLEYPPAPPLPPPPSGDGYDGRVGPD